MITWHVALAISTLAPAQAQGEAARHRVDYQRVVVSDGLRALSPLDSAADERVRSILRLAGIEVVEPDLHGQSQAQPDDLRLGGELVDAHCDVLSKADDELFVRVDDIESECKLQIHWRLATASGVSLYEATVVGTGRAMGEVRGRDAVRAVERAPATLRAWDLAFSDAARRLAGRHTFTAMLDPTVSTALDTELDRAGPTPVAGDGPPLPVAAATRPVVEDAEALGMTQLRQQHVRGQRMALVAGGALLGLAGIIAIDQASRSKELELTLFGAGAVAVAGGLAYFGLRPVKDGLSVGPGVALSGRW